MSPANEPQLPLHRDINISLFLQTLGNTATANKFLWTLSFLEILQRRRKSKISFEDISRGMVRYAVAPIYEYKLYFGGVDKTEEYCAGIFPDYDKGKAPIVGYKSFLPKTAEQKFQKVRRHQLEVYVPYRWLTPFFQRDLRGLRDVGKNAMIRKLAGERFGDKLPPPYQFEGNGDKLSIVLSPLWQEYFLTSMGVIRGWAMWHWAKFLQNKNPGIPGIINKLDGARDRRQMAEQRKFWKAVIEQRGGSIQCIYSGCPVAFSECDIDHYIPWNYVGHSHLWNLVPVLKKANRSKNNQLPETSIYLRRFVKEQHRALEIHRDKFPQKWKKLMEPYLSDLKISQEGMQSERTLYRAYRKLFIPNIDIARNSGFAGGWEWQD